MNTHPFEVTIDNLPETLAIFPLPGALLLPRGVLPLNIFEPRYLNMTLDALGNGRLIGMIQPDTNQAEGQLYTVGCAGRITAFQETDDGRLLINLTGVCRFSFADELEPRRGYRRVNALWQSFAEDLMLVDTMQSESSALIDTATRYFKAKEIECDVERLKELSTLDLTNFLAMHLPFEPAAKQAILEANDLQARTQSLIALTEMSLADDNPPVRH